MEQTHLAFKLVSVEGEGWRMEITCAPRCAKWLLLWRKWDPGSDLRANIKEHLGYLLRITETELSPHRNASHSFTMASRSHPFLIFLTLRSGCKLHGPICQGLQYGEFPESGLDFKVKAKILFFLMFTFFMLFSQRALGNWRMRGY